jgi:acetyltransferase-like isoleucine patch superfamily enzyme
MSERFVDWKRPIIEHNRLTEWNWMVSHPENLILGKNTDIGAFCYLAAHEGIEIGDDTQIGSHTAIYSLNTIENKKGKVIIGRNVRIGSHCTILQGVSIGDNTIIGAHSLVKDNIPSDCIAFGVPAKVKMFLRSIDDGAV